MCIVNGGVKMKSGLVRYECKAKGCEKLWALMPKLVIVGKPPQFCGYDKKGYRNFRKEGHCDCGEPFDHPSIFIETNQNRK